MAVDKRIDELVFRGARGDSPTMSSDRLANLVLQLFQRRIVAGILCEIIVQIRKLLLPQLQDLGVKRQRLAR